MKLFSSIVKLIFSRLRPTRSTKSGSLQSSRSISTATTENATQIERYSIRNLSSLPGKDRKPSNLRENKAFRATRTRIRAGILKDNSSGVQHFSDDKSDASSTCGRVGNKRERSTSDVSSDFNFVEYESSSSNVGDTLDSERRESVETLRERIDSNNSSDYHPASYDTETELLFFADHGSYLETVDRFDNCRSLRTTRSVKTMLSAQFPDNF